MRLVGAPPSLCCAFASYSGSPTSASWRGQLEGCQHADFEAWTRSEAFRAAHRDAGQGWSLTISHPEFEGFGVIRTVPPPGQSEDRLSWADRATGAVPALIDA